MTIKGNTHEKLKLLAEFLIQKAAVGRGRVNRPSLKGNSVCVHRTAGTRAQNSEQTQGNARHGQVTHSLRQTVNNSRPLTLSDFKILNFTIIRN